MMTTRPTSACGKTVEEEEVFDLKVALEMTEDDTELLSEMIDVFTGETVELLTHLEAAVISGNCDSVRKTAHRLKGAAASVGGARIRLVAHVLERMGADGKLGNAEALVSDIKSHIEDYLRATDRFGKESR
jgi:HPt (histidine-containing phosphotransfer) domain-containing protein